MQKPADRALNLLNLLRRQTGKEERLTELLRDPDSGATPGWSIHVPTCFNDALDIRQTQRKVDGKAVLTWTQGPNFGFSSGDVLYDRPEAYQQWSEALKHVTVCVQVRAASPKTLDGTGGASTPGIVTFDILKPTPDRKTLESEATHSLPQEAFVRFLITGTGLPSPGDQ